MKDKIYKNVDAQREKLVSMSDQIFDFSELGNQEYKSSKLISDYLLENGFSSEMGVGGLETAFRAEYSSGKEDGSIRLGLLCEYDAVEGLGHVCGHHMQGPVVAGAAVALKQALNGRNCKIIIYGTPAEETTSGKIAMQNNGCFRDIDVALMFHASNTTTTDIKSMASAKFEVSFKGVSSHAAIRPENGRSALDALLLTFQGIEFLREHVREDTRIHYSVLNGGGPANAVHSEASGVFYIRSYNNAYLESLILRFEKVVNGAAMMTETQPRIKKLKVTMGKIPVLSLNELLMQNARLLDAPAISKPREKTGSTDFGNVMYMVPGSCIRVAFVAPEANSHSSEYFEAGKSHSAHDAVILGAKILAASCADLIINPELFKKIRDEFALNKKTMDSNCNC